MGQVSFGELAFWLVTQRRPTRQQVRVFEAVLVALAEHGFTPTAIAARLTYLSAPDSVQGALAAGLLGGGSRFLGVTEDCGAFLAAALAAAGEPLPADGTTRAGTRSRGGGAAGPGGWEVRPRSGPPGAQGHRPADPGAVPRSPTRKGCAARTCGCWAAVGRVHPRCCGRTLPLNGAGTCGAALADLGLPVGAAARLRAAGAGGRAARPPGRGAVAAGRHGRLHEGGPQRGVHPAWRGRGRVTPAGRRYALPLPRVAEPEIVARHLAVAVSYVGFWLCGGVAQSGRASGS